MLNKKTKAYYGVAEKNGGITFDLFHENKNKSLLMIGKMGTGKSVINHKWLSNESESHS